MQYISATAGRGAHADLYQSAIFNSNKQHIYTYNNIYIQYISGSPEEVPMQTWHDRGEALDPPILVNARCGL